MINFESRATIETNGMPLTFNKWEKNGKRRIYINDYKRRTLGYIDMISGEFTKIDGQGRTNDEINAAIESFKSQYTF